MTIGRLLTKQADTLEDDDANSEVEEEAETAADALHDSDDFELLEKSKASEPNGNGKASKKNKKSKR